MKRIRKRKIFDEVRFFGYFGLVVVMTMFYIIFFGHQ
jgi:hypothetical protein